MRLTELFAVISTEWLVENDQFRSSTLILLALAALGLLAAILFQLRVIGGVLWVAGVSKIWIWNPSEDYR